MERALRALPHRSLFAAYAVSALLLSACASEAPPPAQSPAPHAPGPAVPFGAFGYRLPVIGTWRVHRTHYGVRNDQAYAVDLVFYGEGGLSLRGRRKNAEFPSYGQPIVADAPGVVAVAVDGIPDNEPGVVNKYDMHGNYVVIDHLNGEYSLMAHLIPGSVSVRAGQRVEAGAKLGLCGNSGHSSMPHLHWQVMDNVNASLARGLPPRLLPYTRNGEPSADIPQSGDTLASP